MPSTLFNELVKSLSQLGLTTYEAKAYLALLQRHPVNGNELSRLSGVPGPKIYETLDRLTAKGLASPLETEPVTYVPLPYAEFLKYKENDLKSNIRFLEENLGRLALAESPQMIWRILDYGALTAKAAEIISKSRNEILVSFWEEQGRDIREPLAGAAARGVKVTSMQFGPGILDIGKVYRHVMLDTIYQRHGNEMILVADGECGFFMNLMPGGQWEGCWTSNPGVVRMITNYIRHDIYVNIVIERFRDIVFREYGPHLEGLINLD
ncbi:MAG: hypothetical protein K6T66_12550 [Peptococcaceae bacterium]|nr:hypothetical protein [Peptococcaceae bacterium]